jgi:Gas vesicle synthesis protein GvpL/GvpF
LACLLYCVTPNHVEPIAGLAGVADLPVVWHDASDLRVYWTEIANPETLLEPPVRVPAEQKYRQVLKEVALRETALSFPFPAVVPDHEGIDALVCEHHDYYAGAFERLADTIEYQLTATWADEENSDRATPVSGREYLKRRQESEARIAAIDAKLKTVAGTIVRDWRSRHERRKHVWFALVHRDDRERFIAALRSAGPSEGVRLRLGGPWPPDEFVGSGIPTQ